MSPAAPYWLDKPTNLVLAPEENGRLVCRANGNPKPSIQWLLNGQPIDSMDNVTLLLCIPLATLGRTIEPARSIMVCCGLQCVSDCRERSHVRRVATLTHIRHVAAAERRVFISLLTFDPRCPSQLEPPTAGRHHHV